ncbi:MAG: hypothetical protein RJQ04_17260 [Longimicrobiales bacterium]
MPRRLLMVLPAATAAAFALASVTVGDAELRPGFGPEVLEAADDGVRPLPFHYDLYTFRGNDDSTTVVASFAVPAGELERQRDTEWGVRYGFDVTLVLSDTALHRVARTDDSVYVQVPTSLDGDHLLHTHIEVLAPPSRSTWQRVIMTDATEPGIGTLYHTPFPIPDYSGERLMLSDIALGLPGATEGWTRRGVTLALLPTSQFPESAFDVYYEVYNLPPGTDYATEIAVEPVGRDADRADARSVRARFTGEAESAADSVLAELRRVETALPEGRYRLTVTVTDAETGSTASRSRLFHVRGWSKGATLVEALPSRARATR